MVFSLGIDTGGTYTDAVLIDQASGKVWAAFKAFTTHHNLAVGIGEAINGVFGPEARKAAHTDRAINPGDVGLVGLSTTLATNAIVEGHGSSVCLLLIGYDAKLIRARAFERELVTPHVVYIEGGHNIDGDERTPLDEAALCEAIFAYRNRVAAFAISGYFGVRNPEHELRARDVVEALTADERGLPLPVTCGHDLTSKLNAIRRATTVTLNAQLIPTLRDLILTVRDQLDALQIAAPLMIVKGDGSLVSSDWAVKRPIETILSGPAASVVGAWHVAGRRDAWVVDVGGTTTDIAALREGRPRLNAQGASVGRWRTMVEAADVHTIGLGGDSHVYLNGADGRTHAWQDGHPLAVGPQRVLPLCRLAVSHPEILGQLERQQHLKKRPMLSLVGQFLTRRRQPDGGLSDSDQALVVRLRDGPIALTSLARNPAYSAFLAERVSRLTARQVALRAGFTPTDALHVLGHYKAWHVEASRLGAELLAKQLGISAKAFCQLVVEAVSRRITTELVTKVMSDEVAPADWAAERVAAGLLARALRTVTNTDLACSLTLHQPIVAVGAPVEAYLPDAAASLSTELIVPEYAGVANAIGAVIGSVVQRARVLIRPVDFGEAYRVHLPGNLGLAESVRDFATVEDGVAYAQTTVPPILKHLAEEAGAAHIEATLERTDRTGAIREKADEAVFLETVLAFTAVGRPAAAERGSHRLSAAG